MTLRSGEPLVVDESVAIKRVIPEPGSERAELLLDHGPVAPDILFPECFNALCKKVRRGELTKEEAEIAARTFLMRGPVPPRPPGRRRVKVLRERYRRLDEAVSDAAPGAVALRRPELRHRPATRISPPRKRP